MAFVKMNCGIIYKTLTLKTLYEKSNNFCRVTFFTN